MLNSSAFVTSVMILDRIVGSVRKSLFEAGAKRMENEKCETAKM